MSKRQISRRSVLQGTLMATVAERLGKFLRPLEGEPGVGAGRR